MTLRSSSRTHLLLVNPAQAQWLDARGQALPEPPSTVGVRVVADLVEETHVRIQCRASWAATGRASSRCSTRPCCPMCRCTQAGSPLRPSPLLPKPFGLHAVGVSSPMLMGQLDALVQATPPG